MSTLNEMFGCEGKGSSLGISTYNAQEEGRLNLSYQLEMTISAKLDKLSTNVETKLVSYMKNELGYARCDVNKRHSTIYVDSIDGIRPALILKYIKKNIDPNAKETGLKGQKSNFADVARA